MSTNDSSGLDVANGNLATRAPRPIVPSVSPPSTVMTTSRQVMALPPSTGAMPTIPKGHGHFRAHGPGLDSSGNGPIPNSPVGGAESETLGGGECNRNLTYRSLAREQRIRQPRDEAASGRVTSG